MRGSDQPILDALTDAVLALDAEERVTFANRSATTLFGQRREDLEGRPASELLSPAHRRGGNTLFHALVTPEGASPLAPPRLAVLRRGTLEIRQDVFVTPLGHGGLVVTFRGPAEEDAGSATSSAHGPDAETFRAIFEHAPIGIFHFDPAGVITSCNERFVAILGSSKRLLLGLDMRSLPNRALVAELTRALGGVAGLYEGPYQPATGVRESWVRVSFAPLFEGGALMGGVGLVDDLTERKHIEARLAEADRMASLGRLSAGVAHELNNPLTYVRTGVELALREAETLSARAAELGQDAEWRRLHSALQSGLEGIERVREIVAGLKAFSRSDDTPPRRVSLEACADTAVNLAWNEIRHRATLEKSYGGVPPVIGSETRFVQVLVNLLVNAAQAIPVGDRSRHRITVRTFVLPGARVAVEVEDTGRGMTPEVRRHIFEPFWTDKARGEGTGLGLSICHGIISAAGGEIDVRSNPGVGSLFRVVLPEAQGPEAASPPPDAVPRKSLPPSAQKSRVLIVDDEPRLAWTLRMALSDRHDVVVVGGGKEAIGRLLGEEHFDLVLCDLMMPDVSGMDVFEAITQARPELTSRFVFMTGGAFTDRARAFLQDPRVRRLEKPFLIEDVEALIPPPTSAAPSLRA